MRVCFARLGVANAKLDTSSETKSTDKTHKALCDRYWEDVELAQHRDQPAVFVYPLNEDVSKAVRGRVSYQGSKVILYYDDKDTTNYIRAWRKYGGPEPPKLDLRKVPFIKEPYYNTHRGHTLVIQATINSFDDSRYRARHLNKSIAQLRAGQLRPWFGPAVFIATCGEEGKLTHVTSVRPRDVRVTHVFFQDHTENPLVRLGQAGPKGPEAVMIFNPLSAFTKRMKLGVSLFDQSAHYDQQVQLPEAPAWIQKDKQRYSALVAHHLQLSWMVGDISHPSEAVHAWPGPNTGESSNIGRWLNICVTEEGDLKLDFARGRAVIYDFIHGPVRLSHIQFVNQYLDDAAANGKYPNFADFYQFLMENDVPEAQMPNFWAEEVLNDHAKMDGLLEQQAAIGALGDRIWEAAQEAAGYAVLKPAAETSTTGGNTEGPSGSKKKKKKKPKAKVKAAGTGETKESVEEQDSEDEKDEDEKDEDEKGEDVKGEDEKGKAVEGVDEKGKDEKGKAVEGATSTEQKEHPSDVEVSRDSEMQDSDDEEHDDEEQDDKEYKAEDTKEAQEHDDEEHDDKEQDDKEYKAKDTKEAQEQDDKEQDDKEYKAKDTKEAQEQDDKEYKAKDTKKVHWHEEDQGGGEERGDGKAFLTVCDDAVTLLTESISLDEMAEKAKAYQDKSVLEDAHTILAKMISRPATALRFWNYPHESVIGDEQSMDELLSNDRKKSLEFLAEALELDAVAELAKARPPLVLETAQVLVAEIRDMCNPEEVEARRHAAREEQQRKRLEEERKKREQERKKREKEEREGWIEVGKRGKARRSTSGSYD